MITIMKKALLLGLMLLPLAVSAAVEIDGIYYNLNSDAKTAEVTFGTNGYSGDVVIPESVTHDGVDYSVTSIGDEAFNNCHYLVSVNISNHITSIGKYAFCYCYKLSSINIPASITSIEMGVFAGCYELTKVEIHSNAIVSQDYEWLSGKYLYNILGNYVQEVVIGEEVTKIGKCAFWGYKSLISVTIPNSVTTIGSGAFSGCEKLTSITIPSSVTSIENNPFNACSGLLSIQVEEGNMVYDSRNNCNAIIKTADNEIITGCQNTIIPNNVTSIGPGAFHMCNGLTSIDIPSSVTTIKGGAFWYCTGLTSVSIPNSVTTIGEQAFMGCSALTSVNIPNGISTIESAVFAGCGITSITIPNSVTTIGEEAFSGCQLTSLTIPKSVVSIASSSFRSCAYTLTAIQVESDNTMYDSRENCNAIINSADNTLILGCQNSIIPNDIEKIGDYAFNGCSELTSIDIPNSVKSIGDYAFYYCYKINTVIIPNGTTTIGEYAFEGCGGLKTIVLPKTITTIGNYAFNYLGSKEIYCYAEQLPEIGNYVFFPYSGAYSTLHVPAAAIETYKNAAQWKDFGTIVALTDEDPKPTGIQSINNDVITAERYYSLDGKYSTTPQRGLNIIRMSDGTMKKVFLK